LSRCAGIWTAIARLAVAIVVGRTLVVNALADDAGVLWREGAVAPTVDAVRAVAITRAAIRKAAVGNGKEIARSAAHGARHIGSRRARRAGLGARTMGDRNPGGIGADFLYGFVRRVDPFDRKATVCRNRTVGKATMCRNELSGPSPPSPGPSGAVAASADPGAASLLSHEATMTTPRVLDATRRRTLAERIEDSRMVY
jgi:hypothetical protein